MAPFALLLLLAQAAPPLEDLAHESRAVRDAAIRGLAAGGPPSAEIAALLADPDERKALGAAEVLRRRRDPDVFALLARAADVPDAARGAAAARALVATAAEARVDAASLAFPGMAVLPARLDEAWREAVRETLLALDGGPSADRPQAYRALHAGGPHAARALRELAAEVHAPGAARAHALHALALLAGEAPAGFLADPEPSVRGAAATLVLRHGDEEALARLAARLEETDTLQTVELHCAVLAARRTRRVGPGGAAVLERAVRNRESRLAADAAAALLAADREAGERALRARVLRHLEEAAKVPRSGCEAAIFELRAGPLPEDLRERMRATGDPLLGACVAGDAAALRPLLASEDGTREGFRVEVVARLLARAGAPEADRVVFAAGVASSDASSARRAGLEALRGVDPRKWSALLDAVTAALAEPDEPVRVAAAALLLPDPRAVAVCADALYDGDPWTARRVASMLSGAGLAAPDPRAPVAERRRASRELRRLPGKE